MTSRSPPPGRRRRGRTSSATTPRGSTGSPTASRATSTTPRTSRRRRSSACSARCTPTSPARSRAGCTASPPTSSSTRPAAGSASAWTPWARTPSGTRRATSSARPERAFEHGNLDLDIQRALDELPPEYRAAVVLCDIEGLSYEEIAVTLGIKLGTVRSRIHRARARLRVSLEHRAPEARSPRAADDEHPAGRSSDEPPRVADQRAGRRAALAWRPPSARSRTSRSAPSAPPSWPRPARPAAALASRRRGRARPRPHGPAPLARRRAPDAGRAPATPSRRRSGSRATSSPPTASPAVAWARAAGAAGASLRGDVGQRRSSRADRRRLDGGPRRGRGDALRARGAARRRAPACTRAPTSACSGSAVTATRPRAPARSAPPPGRRRRRVRGHRRPTSPGCGRTSGRSRASCPTAGPSRAVRWSGDDARRARGRRARPRRRLARRHRAAGTARHDARSPAPRPARSAAARCTCCRTSRGTSCGRPTRTVVQVVGSQSSGDAATLVGAFPGGAFDDGVPARITRGWDTVTGALERP